MISIFGHKSPDSDTVLSAVILSEFFKGKGETAKPYVLGKINGESRYILDKYETAHPKLLNSLDEVADTEIAVVDTTTPNQLPDGIGKMKMRMIVDHHNLGGIATMNACEIWGRAYGSTCTILYELFKYYRVGMSKTVSALMLCGILTDTLCFSLSTSTDKDREIAKKLAKSVGEDIPALWQELLTAKSDISNLTDEELLMQDAKEFVFGGKNFIIGNIEINNSAVVLPRLPAVKEKMQEIKKIKGCFAVMLNVIDISKSKTLFVAYTDDNEKIEKLFNLRLTDNEAEIDKLISRKKDIVTVLQAGF
jgi:manganese-dependent inorganic pyrophosphatase